MAQGSGHIWDCTIHKPVWGHMAKHMGPCCTRWHHTLPKYGDICGSIHGHLGYICGHVWTRWGHTYPYVGPYGTMYGHILDHIVQYMAMDGATWQNVWPHMGPYGRIYGNILAHRWAIRSVNLVLPSLPQKTSWPALLVS